MTNSKNNLNEKLFKNLLRNKFHLSFSPVKMLIFRYNLEMENQPTNQNVDMESDSF